MSIQFRQTFAAKITHIIGVLVAFITLFTGLSGASSADKLDFELASTPTTESTRVYFVLKNNSAYPIDNEIVTDKFEKNNNGQWQEYTLHPFINSFPAIKYVFPAGCILPGETIDAHALFESLTYTDDTYTSSSKTLEAGIYRITIGYKYKSLRSTDYIYKTLEFEVLPA